MTKTVKAIMAEADEQIYQIVLNNLTAYNSQLVIASRLDVSPAWVSRFVEKNRSRLKADGAKGWGRRWRDA